MKKKIIFGSNNTLTNLKLVKDLNNFCEESGYEFEFDSRSVTYLKRMDRKFDLLLLTNDVMHEKNLLFDNYKKNFPNLKISKFPNWFYTDQNLNTIVDYVSFSLKKSSTELTEELFKVKSTEKLKKYLIALDIGGTFLKWAIIKDMKILDKGKVETYKDNVENKSNYLESVESTIKTLILNHGKPKNIVISTFGSVNKYGAFVDSRIKEIINFNLKKWIVSKFGSKIKVFIDNDANCALYGQVYLNNLEDKKHISFLAIGTSIGGATLVNNELIRGFNDSASEFSEIIVDGSNNIGKVGNSVYLTSQIKLKSKNKISINKALELDFTGKKSNPEILKIVDKWYKNIAIAISNIIFVINNDILIIGGGITENKFFNVKKIHNYVKKFSSTLHGEKLEIIKAKEGNDSQLIGAAFMAIKK